MLYIRPTRFGVWHFWFRGGYERSNIVKRMENDLNEWSHFGDPGLMSHRNSFDLLDSYKIFCFEYIANWICTISNIYFDIYVNYTQYCDTLTCTVTMWVWPALWLGRSHFVRYLVAFTRFSWMQKKTFMTRDRETRKSRNKYLFVIINCHAPHARRLWFRPETLSDVCSVKYYVSTNNYGVKMLFQQVINLCKSTLLYISSMRDSPMNSLWKLETSSWWGFQNSSINLICTSKGNGFGRVRWCGCALDRMAVPLCMQFKFELSLRQNIHSLLSIIIMLWQWGHENEARPVQALVYRASMAWIIQNFAGVNKKQAIIIFNIKCKSKLSKNRYCDNKFHEYGRISYFITHEVMFQNEFRYHRIKIIAIRMAGWLEVWMVRKVGCLKLMFNLQPSPIQKLVWSGETWVERTAAASWSPSHLCKWITLNDVVIVLPVKFVYDGCQSIKW